MIARASALVSLLTLLASCQASPATGALCARGTDCPSQLVCSRARCRTGCVTSRDCPTLARCLVDPSTSLGTCSLDVDSCATHDCPVGFLCRDDQCLNACGSIVACPDGLCVDGACVSVRGDAGVVPSDAAIDGGLVTNAVVALAAGLTHFCAVTAGGALWCWGSSAQDELGDRTFAHGTCAACAPSPVRAVDASSNPLTGVTGVAAGSAYTCALIAGQAQCWGQGPLGTLAASAADPQIVETVSGGIPARLTGVTRLFGGGLEHACALVGATSDIWCWGVDGDGRLGDGLTTDSPRAVRSVLLPSMPGTLTASRHHMMALTQDGHIVGVGNNDALELGVASSTHAVMPVTAAYPTARVLSTAAGVSCAVFPDEALSCWGQLCMLVSASTAVVCPNGTCSIVPNAFAAPSGEHILGVAITDAGGPAACVWTDRGDVFCVGGAPAGPGVATLTQRTGLSSVVEIVAGQSAMCARTSGGQVLCWGDDTDGQLGRGTHDDGAFPMPMAVTIGP